MAAFLLGLLLSTETPMGQKNITICVQGWCGYIFKMVKMVKKCVSNCLKCSEMNSGIVHFQEKVIYLMQPQKGLIHRQTDM